MDVFWLGQSSDQLFDPSRRQPVLMELVGCTGLSSLLRSTTTAELRRQLMGRTSMDPYCVVQLVTKNNNGNGETALEIHRTQSCEDTANPIWTVRTKSLCLLNLGTSKTNNNTNNTRVAIQIWTPQPVPQKLGTVTLTLEEIRAILERQEEANDKDKITAGARLEFPILPEKDEVEKTESKGEEKKDHNEQKPAQDSGNSATSTNDNQQTTAPALLALRLRKATRQDQVFLGMTPQEDHTGIEGDDDDDEDALMDTAKQYKETGSFDALDVVTIMDKEITETSSGGGFWGGSSNNNNSNNNKMVTRQRKMHQEAADFEFHEVVHKSLFRAYRKKQPHKATTKASFREHADQHMYRLLPGPDPRGKDEWMTNSQMEEEILKPSHHFVPAGTGTVGKCFVEILSCQNLPNMDEYSVNLFGSSSSNGSGENGSSSTKIDSDNSTNKHATNSNKQQQFHSVDQTDSFVAMVMEDTMVRTDMIWDKLNPKWLPWTMRAFTFHMRHPSSLLLLGVFDYDETPLENHDAIGRVVINVANFEPNTTYILHYKLQHDPRKTPEESDRGIITLRLRVEWNNQLEATKLAFTAPPECIINCKTDKTYQVLRYLKRGALDMEQSSMDAIMVYAGEIGSYWYRYCHFLDILFEVFLWRGRLKLSSSTSIWFPHHSVALSLAVFACLEYPRYIGTVFFYSLAWILLAINFHNGRHPYPWKRTKKWLETNAVLVLGRSIAPPIQIEPDQGLVAGRNRDKVDELRGKRMSNLIFQSLSFMYEIYKIYSTTSVSAKFFSTNQRDRFNMTQNLLGSKLYYPHMMFKYLCKYSRVYLRFINWDGYAANSIVSHCLIIATLWLFLPLNYILLWVTRILCWCLLGPWMKLADMYFVRSWYKTSEELAEMVETGFEEFGADAPDFDSFLQSQWLAQMSRSGRLVAEDALKLKDMRDHVFGSYSEFIPFLDDSRYPSIPLPQSTAEPYLEPEETDSDPKIKSLARFVRSQKLRGVMVMTRDLGSNTPSTLNGETGPNGSHPASSSNATNGNDIFRRADDTAVENDTQPSHLKAE